MVARALPAMRAVLLLGGLLACASAPPFEGVGPVPSGLEPDRTWELLGPGDVLRVAVFGHPELSTRADGSRIDPEGNLHLPLTGPVAVAGLRMTEASKTIAAAAGAFVRAPKVDLSVVSWGPRDVYLIGQVDEPGPYALDRSLNVSQALSLGGSLLPGADRENVYLLRPGAEGFHVHRFDATRPSADWLVAVRPDDVLFVPRGSHGSFADEVLPYLQGIGHLTGIPIAFAQLD